MLIAVVVLQLLMLGAFLWSRTGRVTVAVDPRQAQVPDQLAQLQARHEAMDGNLRSGLAEIRREAATVGLSGRRELAETLDRFREDNVAAAAGLRGEVLGTLGALGDTLQTELASFRVDMRDSAQKLQTEVHGQHEAIQHRLGQTALDGSRYQVEAQQALHARLAELGSANEAHQERLRARVGESLERLTQSNTEKLEQMRATVDEKLHATLHTRLAESFGQVTDQLNKVHTGLGEMSKLSEGVDGLSRIFTNVKARGGFAEVQLGVLLRQMLAPGQFVENANVRPGTTERVEYAVRFPSNAGERLLPIDAKFPLDAWERLEAAYETNGAEAIAREGRNFENAIRTEAERICKYINPPVTTPYGIMFLPTEGLYAEVIRREALQADIQAKCHVTIAGPTTLSAILTSFQMGFHMLALQEKGDEVWKVLERTKGEFATFETLMGKMEAQVGTVQNTIQKLGVRTRAINRNLRDVSTPGEPAVLAFDERDESTGTLRLVAANED